MSETILTFKDVKKEFTTGTVSEKVLKGVDFSVDKGEFVIIVGTSGTGKSTVLNLLGGLDKPTSGQIIVAGDDISKYSEKQLTAYRANRIGFVFQFYNLIPNLNVMENVVFGCEVKKDVMESDVILKKVNMGDKIKAFPTTLSGGEQQRVAIARAISKKPDILICDEPTGALDYQTSKQVLECIEELNRDMNMTIVLVTHNDAICPMADKIIRMHNGRVKDVTLNKNKISVKDLEW